MNHLLEVKDLTISVGDKLLVDGLNFSLERGKTLALVGESGSGKSLTALAMARLLPSHLQIQGAIEFKDQAMLELNEAELKQLRGNEIAYVFQEPMLSLNPLHTIGNQIAENIFLHASLDKKAVKNRVLELLKQVGLENIPANRYPHELSGGQKQRVMLAMSIACQPSLLILDEPTTALDVSVQMQILALLEQLQKDLGIAMLFISHDLNVVKQMADDILVLKQGKMCEHGNVDQIFNQPKHDYTKDLLAAVRLNSEPLSSDTKDVVLDVQSLKVEVLKKSHWFKPNEMACILHPSNFHVFAGKTLGIVGESGSGKTTLALALLNLIAYSGNIVYQGRTLERVDKAAWFAIRKELQIVFQDPYSALNPRMKTFDLIAEGLNLHASQLSKEEINKRIHDVVEEVGLNVEDLERYPHEFSGGQRQRINIARALLLRPKILILDEPTSALDVVLQQKMIRLLLDLQQKYQMSYIFISHDLKVIQALSHHILVLKDGHIVELGSSKKILFQPQHAYTKNLIQSSFLHK